MLSGRAVPAAARMVPTAIGPTLELDSEPFDGVDEPVAGEIDGYSTREQKYDVEHGGASLLGRRRGRDAVRGQQTPRPTTDVLTTDVGSKVSPTHTTRMRAR